MNKIVIALLLTAGFAFAAEREGTAPKMHGWTKVALNTQSPRVKLAKSDHYRAPKEGYRITEDKTTINAYIPYGK